MRNLVSLRTMMTAALLLTLSSCGGRSEPSPPAPPILRLVPDAQVDLSQHPLKYRDCNLIFVSLDALQAAHVGCLGHHRNVTPTIDRLARHSCVFTNTMSVASWTVPSSMTWFTGVYPTEHRLTNKFAVYNDREQQRARLGELAPQLLTMGDMLAKNGYATAAFTGNAGVSRDFGFGQGFNVYWHETGKFGGLEQSVPRAIEWLRANSSRKFALFLHGYDCHAQYALDAGFDYRFVAANYDRRYTGSPREHEMLREEGLDHGQLALRPADIQFWRAIYDERIQRADAHLASFLTALDELGLAENTLLVVTSDHGTEYYEHRRFDHGFTLYQELLHVPLFIRLPDQPGCRIVTDRVSSIDLLPTLFDLLDLELSEPMLAQLRGQSLVPTLRGAAANRDIISETDYREYTFKRSLISPDGWKLVYTLETRSRELFDLNTDPLELVDVAAQHPQRADELERRLFEFYRRLGHDLQARTWRPGLNPVYDSQGAKPATGAKSMLEPPGR